MLLSEKKIVCDVVAKMPFYVAKRAKSRLHSIKILFIVYLERFEVLKLRVGIVDDRSIDLEKLVAIIGAMEQLEIVFATTSANEAYEEIKNQSIDLLIADIEMPDLSGYELADISYFYFFIL